MSNPEPRLLRDAFTNASAFNQLDFIIERKLRQLLNTSALVRVDACTSSGAGAPAGTVAATPLVAETDGFGNAVPMASIPRMPHFRLQGGIAAIIIDPVPGDIGVASFCKNDSSRVTGAEAGGQAPASNRVFDQADGMLVATVSNRAPKVWIELTQDQTVIIHAPKGVVIETDESVDVNAAKQINLNAPLITTAGPIQQGQSMGSGGSRFEGGFTNTGGEITSNGVTLETHVHGGVEPGSGTTGGPQ